MRTTTLHISSGCGVATEKFTAQPLTWNCFAITNVLRNYALAIGDVVGAAWDEHKQLHVTEVYCLQPGWYVQGLLFDEHNNPTTMKFLTQTAIRITTIGNIFVGQWSLNYSRKQLLDLFATMQPAIIPAIIFHPEERLRWLYKHVQPFHSAVLGNAKKQNHYQAAQDPEWFNRGLATPQFLRHIQTLIRDNHDLRHLVETREYDRALRWIQVYDATYARLTRQ
ncbi:MAG: hypothetical protein Q4A82_02395 [Corynebacterium sp.]|nr:hypothetical protein [Corynebacterium sp.]